MEIKSLGFKTDLFINSHFGEIIDRGDYLVIKNENPNYFWGNLLYFSHAPEKNDFKRWEELFKDEFPNPAIYHKTFAWDCDDPEEGDRSAFVTSGYKQEVIRVLSTEVVHKNKKITQMSK